MEVLLIGEAPGYKGCKITGIPFTSGEVVAPKKLKETVRAELKEAVTKV